VCVFYVHALARVCVCARAGLNGLLSHTRKVPLGFGRHGGLVQDDHVVLGGVQRLVDPVHAAGHVTGVAGHQHQVTDREEEGGGSGEERVSGSIISQ